MSVLKTRYDFIQSEEFRQRVLMASKKAAHAIQGEAVPNGDNGAHTKRQRFAFSVLSAPAFVTTARGRSWHPIFERITESVGAVGQPASATDDAALEGDIAAIWDDLSGVEAGDRT